MDTFGKARASGKVAKGARQAKRQPRLELPAGPPFTAETLRTLFVEKQILRGPKGLRQTFNMPDDAALAELAAILGFWKMHFWREQKTLLPQDVWRRQANSKLLEFAATLAKLRTGLAAIRDGVLAEFETLERAPVGVQEALKFELRRRLANVAHVFDGIGRIDNALGFSKSGDYSSILTLDSIDKPTGWTWLADVLPVDFHNSLQSTNPGLTLGVGHGGPTPRFIAAVAPFVTGECPSVGSVATQLKARRKGGTQVP